MRKFVALPGLFLLFSGSASAQAYPKIETSAGYMYLRVNAGGAGGSADCHGGYGSVALNFNKWIGAVGDASRCNVTGLPSGSSATSAFTYLFGPKVAYRWCRLTPYAQVLAGGVRGSGATFGSTSGATNAFAMSAGGGLDFRPFRRCSFAIRVLEVDYLLTRFNSSNQNNVQIKFGIVLRWGGQ